MGFLQKIMGLTIEEQKSFLVPEELDSNGDLLNDLTNSSIMGFTSGIYTNKSLKFEVKIHSIDNKTIDDLPTHSQILQEGDEEPFIPDNSNTNSKDDQINKIGGSHSFHILVFAFGIGFIICIKIRKRGQSIFDS